MNTDDFEQRLQRQPLRPVPADWKVDILRAAEAAVDERAPRVSWAAQCWQELFWSCRRVWFGLAAVWGLILLINVAPVGPAREMVQASNQNPVDLVHAFQAKQKQIMAELGMTTSLDAERPKTHSPLPHSERRPLVVCV